MPDTWAWGLRTFGGSPLTGAHLARGRRLVYVRNHAAMALMTLSLSDPGTIAVFEELRNGIPGLTVHRNRELAFAGEWTPMSGGHDKDGNSFVNLVFKDAFSELDYRITEASETFTATDAGTIAEQLIIDTNDNYDPTAINVGTIEASKARDRTYSNKIISEAIIELTEVQGGFDWYPTYLDPQDSVGRTMLFNVAASYGTDQPNARFEFGAGTLDNCTGYSFTTTLPLNHVRVLGAGALVAEAEHPSTSVYNRYMAVIPATDVSEQATLDDKALDALRPYPVMVTQFTGDPAKCPQPWDDFWIGDTIRFNVDDGAVQQQLEARVQTIEIGLDEDDNMDDLVIGIDPGAAGAFLSPSNTDRRYVQQQRDVLRRLSALER